MKTLIPLIILSLFLTACSQENKVLEVKEEKITEIIQEEIVEEIEEIEELSSKQIIQNYYNYMQTGELKKAFDLRTGSSADLETFKSWYEDLSEVNVDNFEEIETDKYSFEVEMNFENGNISKFKVVSKVADGKIENVSSEEVYKKVDLGDGYSKDDEFVYYEGEVIEGADVESFEIIDEGLAKDKNEFYYEGNFITKYSYLQSNFNKNYTTFSSNNCSLDRLYFNGNIYNKTSNVSIEGGYLAFIEGDSTSNKVFVIFDMQTNKKTYTGKIVNNVLSGMGECFGEFTHFIKSSLGYIIEEGIFDYSNGKIYAYSDTTKNKLLNGYKILYDGSLIINYEEIGSFGEYWGGELFKGNICKQKIVNNKIDIDCEKKLFYNGRTISVEKYDLKLNGYHDDLSILKEILGIKNIIDFYFYYVGNYQSSGYLESAYKLKYKPEYSLEKFKEIYSNIESLEVLENKEIGENKYQTIVEIDGKKYESVFEIIDNVYLKTISTKEL